MAGQFAAEAVGVDVDGGVDDGESRSPSESNPREPWVRPGAF